MYQDYFGIEENPFSLTPDPRYLYMTRGHQEALAHLLYGVREGGGFVLLTGEVGTGKTSVCRCLLDQLPDEAQVALILNPRLSEVELLSSICDELGIEHPEADSVKALVDRLNQHLLELHGEGRHAVLIIDEAQNLSPAVMEQVRLLTNLETDKRKLLQIIFIGQPELGDLLNRKDLRQLAQRISARFHLDPLSASETRDYIAHRLAVGGVSYDIFTPGARAEIYKRSRGVPRLINSLCDRCLLAAYVQETKRIDRKIVRDAAAEVMGRRAIAPSRRRMALPWAVATAAVAVAVLAVLVPRDYADTKVVQSAEMASDSLPPPAAPQIAAAAQEDPRPETPPESSPIATSTALAADVPPAGEPVAAPGAPSVPDSGLATPSTLATTMDPVPPDQGTALPTADAVRATQPIDQIRDEVPLVEGPTVAEAAVALPTTEPVERTSDLMPQVAGPQVAGPQVAEVAVEPIAPPPVAPPPVAPPPVAPPPVAETTRQTARLPIDSSGSTESQADPEGLGADATSPMTLDRLLSATDPVGDETAGAERLFALWQLDHDALAGGDTCAKALAAGLQCLEGRGSLRNLIDLDRPALLPLAIPGGRRLDVVMTGAEGSWMTLEVGEHRLRAPVEDVAAAWSGDFLMLWRPPTIYQRWLVRGQSGADVAWLKNRLAELDGGPAAEAEEVPFDEDLEARVMAFQRSRPLLVDGIVGPRTLIHLNSALGVPDVVALNAAQP